MKKRFISFAVLVTADLLCIFVCFLIAYFIRDSVLPGIEKKIEAGEELTAGEKAHKMQWDETIKHFNPTQETVDEDVAAMRGSYLDGLKHRAPMYFAVSSYLLVFGSFWPAMGLMLLGMGLMKTGVFSASRSKRFYLILAVIGYGAGLPIAWLSASSAIA